jgi:VWFA-related protein
MRDANARIHLQVLRNVALALKGDASERRSVLLVSEGHPIEPAGDGRMNEADARIRDDFRDVLRNAALANVAIYGIDPTGLDVRLTPIATSFSDRANAADAQEVGANLADNKARRRYGSVGQLADSTGGVMTLDRNTLDANLPRLLQDSRRYYRLAYVQPDVASDDRNEERRIEVKVRRERVEVRARKAYLPR